MVCLAGHRLNWSDPVFFAVVTGFWWFYAMCMATWIISVFRHAQSDFLGGGASRTPATPMTSLRCAGIVAGTHIMMFWGIVQMAWGAQDSLGVAIIAGMATALGVVNFFLFRGRNGPSLGPAYIQQLASCSVVLLAIWTVRFDVWVASIYRIGEAELQSRVPTWIVPAFALVLVLWSLFLLSITKPKVPELSPAC